MYVIIIARPPTYARGVYINIFTKMLPGADISNNNKVMRDLEAGCAPKTAANLSLGTPQRPTSLKVYNMHNMRKDYIRFPKVTARMERKIQIKTGGKN